MVQKLLLQILVLSVLQAGICMHSATAQNTFPSNGSAGIGTMAPHTSASLEINSITKGLLISRMTKAQRDAIAAPATGLMIYQTNSTPGFYYYDGSKWVAVSSKGPNKSLSNLTAPTAVNVDVLPGASGSLNLGTAVSAWKNVYFKGSLFCGSHRALALDTVAANIAVGENALYSNTTGYDNTANGSSALYSNTTGYNNTATGSFSLYSGAAGFDNTATGTYSLYFNTTGAYNTANGAYSLYFNTTGYQNAADGFTALYANTTGIRNTAQGPSSLYSNTTGNSNTAVGFGALADNTTGNSNVAIGARSLFTNTTRSNIVAVGDSALYNNGTGAVNPLEASANMAIGSKSLYSNTVGYNNAATGSYSLYSNTAGFDNASTGTYSLYFNTTGAYNTANGAYSLYSNTTGYQNAAHGFFALYANTTGIRNTAQGPSSLYSNTTGNSNTALGYGADVTLGNLSNAMALGSFAQVNASNKVVIGNSTVTAIGGFEGWSDFSDGRFKTNIKENVPGLVFLNKLKPVTYTLELKKFDQFLGRKDDAANGMQAGYAAAEKKIRTGFIAQDVERVSQEINYDFDGVNHPQNEKDNYSIVYADFVPSLVKAVQELSKMNDDKDAKINHLQKQIDELKAMIVSSRSTPVAFNAGVNSQQSTATSAASLEQNVPNPFNRTTSISYGLPQSYSSAKIIVADKAGRVLKETNLAGSGKGNLQLDIPATSGTYTYSLYVNGKLIDTKQMVAAK